MLTIVCVVFFFQAEDGIRGGHVTGVQTCALPIWSAVLRLKLALLCFQRRTVACFANSLLDRMGVQVAFHTYDAPREVSRYSRFGCDVLNRRRDRPYAVTTAHIANFKLKHCRSLFVVEHNPRLNLPIMARSGPDSDFWK